MRFDIGGMHVTVQGVQRVYLLGQTHIGAVVDDDSGQYVLGPYVEGHAMDSPLDVVRHTTPTHGAEPHVPTFSSISEEDYATVKTVLGGLALRLGYPFRHGVNT